MSTPEEDVQSALVWCPFPNEAGATDTAAVLLYESLIACANILPGMRSMFLWRGECTDEAEIGVLFKTNAACLPALTARLTELHPYEEPAILGWRCDAAAPATAAWLGALGPPRS